MDDFLVFIFFFFLNDIIQELPAVKQVTFTVKPVFLHDAHKC